MVDKVKEILEEKIRPRLISHNGDVRLLEVKNGVVRIKLLGACSGCPHSDMTTKDFIEQKLKEEFPWVNEVVISREVSPELIDMAKKILNKSL
ncbi:NifU family protein [Clostridiisalibacter paucivorans]|uniref:NifU family protein n=1 Tax=Clostridiisalibacter paucivorans TaxID=408753 RepID=UPI00047DAF79|nr:NifU family protein [Clostridiisalibacter paucivorans]